MEKIEQSSYSFLEFIFSRALVGLFSDRGPGAAIYGFSLKKDLFILTVQK